MIHFELLQSLSAFLLVFFGAAAGSGLVWFYYRVRIGGHRKIAAELLHRAQLDAETLKKTTDLALKQAEVEQRRALEELSLKEQRKVEREEERLRARQDKIEERLSLVDQKLFDLEQREEELTAHRKKLEEDRAKMVARTQELVNELEKVSGLTTTEARTLLLDRLSTAVRTESALLVRRISTEAEEEADREARRLIALAINRMASSCVSEVSLSTIPLPSDEIKGRIIGREGRNIRALENATGVNFIIDETPSTLLLSGFDPVRKQIAKVALNELILDGRIHPSRIEEAVAKAEQQIEKEIKKAGEEAALQAGAINLHPELIKLLGKLRFRYSYGQNILDHSVEVSHLLGMMAAELGLNQARAKRIGLLHDIGKAVTHEMEGSHATIGYELAKRYGESEEVANGIGCHHQEMPPLTEEGSLCSAADALSAARPGARIEAVEQYIKRLEKLEEIASSFPGVVKAYALQAGREVRVLVRPDLVSDEELPLLAREIAAQVERQLTYPGKIKVTLLRERQVVEYAM